MDDKIIEFLDPTIYESTNFGSYKPGVKIGEINIKISDVVEPYTVHKKMEGRENIFNINFEPKNYDKDKNSRFIILSINDLYNKEYQSKIKPKICVENTPDEYFEIRKIQREKTDF